MTLEETAADDTEAVADIVHTTVDVTDKQNIKTTQ